MHNTIWLRSLFSVFAHYSSPLVYFDNASTAQKPALVSDIFNFVHFRVCANLARGRYFLSSRLDSIHTLARQRILSCFRADARYECVVYKSATEALNRVCLGLRFCFGFRVAVCVTEHHSGLMPWLVAECARKAHVSVIGLDCDHIPDVRRYLELIASGVRLVLVSHMSNVLGALVPIRLYVKVGACANAITVVDGTQAAPHFRLNLARCDCTEYVLTAHKLYGPMGIGVGVGKRVLFNALAPVIVGGGGVSAVSLKPLAYTLAGLPFRHEAGTPMSFGLISLSVLINWRYRLSFDHERYLSKYLWARLSCIKRVCLFNAYLPSTRLLSFEFELIQADDVCSFLNKLFVCIRSGAHCAMPLLAYFCKRALCRVSAALYNTYKDVDTLSFGLSYLSVLS
ncbi:Cysteine desulfurase [Candidatus Hodgkinia cicadicola]|nr:Cysteine desulfurase [Candidatus Hodgkinia cicadicola]